MIAALRLGLFYFATVFAVGFVLGALRTLVLIPVMGEVGAVLLELPVILTAAWVICGRLVRGRRLTVAEAVAMGTTAFVLLMLGEAGLSVWLAGRALADHVALYAQPAHLIGLAGQVAFAVFPVLRS
ncbi:hypothetical protein [Pararhodobacter sp. SW119]|uniref:hypothetical protein n=1 Tax=Pararhodobacter sp. SW119 TaxID=2780075 RepID=UPI001AE09F70|nr:hypothetical protein [Pararhodobacter sp. SW119]